MFIKKVVQSVIRVDFLNVRNWTSLDTSINIGICRCIQNKGISRACHRIIIKMTIYTKNGDKGKTKVFDKASGKLVPVSKMSCKIRSIGTIDELNSILGVVISFSQDKVLQKLLREVQGDLFTINAILAGSDLKFSKIKVKRLERQIDKWEGELPVQKNFIYYGGSQVSSLLFYARGICRRAERSLVSFSRVFHNSLLVSHISPYINRLSDYLFVFGRYENIKNKTKEEFWLGASK